MGANKYIKSTITTEYKDRSQEYKDRMAEWSSQESIVRSAKPTNLPRARALGYKAKEGIIIVRVGVRKGTRKRKTVGGGRKPSKSGRFFSRHKSLQLIAEERASRKFSNYEVLNSYFVGETGLKRFYEIILLSKQSATLKRDPRYAGILAQTSRASRSLTSAGRKSRGIR